MKTKFNVALQTLTHFLFVSAIGTYGYKWDTLKKILNPSFNFDSAVNHVLDSIPPVTLEKVRNNENF